MAHLVLTLTKKDPLVINDAEVIVNIAQIKGSQVLVEIEANSDIAVNRGKVYLNKKLSNSSLKDNQYINVPLKDLYDAGSEEVTQILEMVHQNMKLYNWTTNINLPENTRKMLFVVGQENYLKLIELFLTKFLFVSGLPLNEESVLEFKKDFLGYHENHHC